MTDLTNYGTVTTKDMLARRVYNDELASVESAGVGIIISSANKCLDVFAGTTIAIESTGNMDIVAGAGLDIAVDGALDIESTGVANIDIVGNITFNSTSGSILTQSNGTYTITSGGNMSTGVTGTSNLDVSGAITIDSSGSTIGIGNDAVNQNITIGTGGSRPLIQVGNSITTTASLQTNAIAGDFNFGSGGFILDTADGGAISLDSIGAPSNFSLLSNAAADDLTISLTGATDSSLILSSTGTNAANALEITASAGGLDMNVAGNKTEDVTLTSTTTVGGNVTEDFNANRNTNVAGTETCVIVGTSTITRTGATTTTQTGDETTTNAGNKTTNVNGATGYTLDVAANINIDSAKSAANAIVINASGTDGGIDINTGKGGVDILTTDGGAVSIDAVGAPSNFSLAATADSDDLTISVTGAKDASLVLSSTGTNAGNAIEITASVGGLDMNVKGNKTEDVEGNSTTTVLGNAVDTITGNQTFTVNGATGFTLDCDKIINLDSNDATAGAVKIAASNAAGGIDIDAGTGGINTNTTGTTVSTTTGTTSTTATGAETITNGAGSARTVVGQYSVDSSQAAANAIKFNTSAATGGIDVDAGTGGINTNTTGLSTNTATLGYSVATSGAGSNISITAAGAGAQVISVNCAGTGANALDFNATAGGLDVDVALGVDIQAGTGNINIDTTSGAITFGTAGLTTAVQIGNITGASSSTVSVKNLNVLGTLSTSGNTTQSGDLTIAGNLTVNGTTTTLNTTTITSDDKNIELNSIATPTDVNALGGGITLKAAADKTFIWSTVNTNSTNDSWDSSEDLNIANGKFFTINKKMALTQTSLFVDTGDDTVASDFLDNKPAIYLNQATPFTNAANEWRIKIDGLGDVVFQKRTGDANGWQNKFRIQ
jgi:hypothetical protein